MLIPPKSHTPLFLQLFKATPMMAEDVLFRLADEFTIGLAQIAS